MPPPARSQSLGGLRVTSSPPFKFKNFKLVLGTCMLLHVSVSVVGTAHAGASSNRAASTAGTVTLHVDPSGNALGF